MRTAPPSYPLGPRSTSPLTIQKVREGKKSLLMSCLFVCLLVCWLVCLLESPSHTRYFQILTLNNISLSLSPTYHTPSLPPSPPHTHLQANALTAMCSPNHATLTRPPNQRAAPKTYVQTLKYSSTAQHNTVQQCTAQCDRMNY
jgi:hypothetical protein